MASISKIVFIVAICFSFIKANTYKAHIPWEPDTVLTAWLIKTYVDKKSEFIAVKKGSLVDKKYSINTPYSLIKRNARYTAFEVGINIHSIQENTCIKKLKEYGRVLEMTPWKKLDYENMVKFERNLLTQIDNNKNLNKAFTFIYKFCEDLK